MIGHGGPSPAVAQAASDLLDGLTICQGSCDVLASILSVLRRSNVPALMALTPDEAEGMAIDLAAKLISEGCLSDELASGQVRVLASSDAEALATLAVLSLYAE